MTDVVVGIDPGTACGWAILTMDGARVGSGVWDLAARRHEGGGMRFLRLRKYLDALADSEAICAVAYEEVRGHQGVDAAHIYGGIIATLAAWCEELAIPYQGQPVGTVKKLATGNGAAGKVKMVETANNQWDMNIPICAQTLTAKDGKDTTVYSFPGGGDNEADALWIAEALRRSLGGKA